MSTLVMPCLRIGIACLPLTAFVALVGCSSGRTGERAAGIGPRAADAGLPVATTATDPAAVASGQGTIRPIPEVIARPRPFRLPVAIPAADLRGGPATMRPFTAAGEPSRLVVGRNVAGDGHSRVPSPTSVPRPLATAPAAAPAAPVAPEPPVAAAGRDITGASAPAIAEIRGMLHDYLRAFNRHDPVAVAAHWTAAGESVDLASGEVTAGRDAVRDVFAALFAQDATATIDIDVQSVRPVRNDVAVVDGVTRLSFADGGPAASRFSAVVVKEGGTWMLESVRETTQPAAAPASRPLDELAWLLGAWEDAGEGVTASTQCFWSAGRGFIVRSHAVNAATAPENAPRSGDERIPALLPPGSLPARELTEIIGWDPDRQVLRSWLFTSTGRFAEGTWTRDGDAWTVLIEGRGRDEGDICRCTISRVGADGITVRCDNAALADLLPPACDFMRTARLD